MIAVNDSALAVSRVPIADLHIDPANVRRHDKRNLETIQASLRKFGQQRPILVDAKGVVIAGNGTLIAASNMGWENIDVVRSNLEGAEAIAYAIADNRTAELATWDDVALAETLAALQKDDGFDHLVAGFTDAEIEQLITDAVMPGEVVEDDVPEVQDDATTKPGDVWLLGGHRVLCGDSTKAEDVAVVMAGAVAEMVFTDPPYGVSYDGGTTVRDKLVGDGNTDLYKTACDMAAKHSDAKAPLYLWHAGVKGIAAAAAAAAAAAGYEIRTEIIWNKNQAQFGALSAQYKQKHEPCYYCFKRGTPPRWFGPTNEVTVWDYDRSSRNDYHPTQKPVALAYRAIGNSSPKDGRVLDLFLGSGATLIAAEQLGRKCYGIEIEPRYCDVVVRRWQKLTGKTATRESDGAEFPSEVPDG